MSYFVWPGGVVCQTLRKVKFTQMHHGWTRSCNRSHSLVKHCALLTTYLNDIVTDATSQLRDLLWIGIRMLSLAREAEEVKTLLGIVHPPDK